MNEWNAILFISLLVTGLGAVFIAAIISEQKSEDTDTDDDT